MKRYFSIIRRHERPIRFLAGRLLVKSGACRCLRIPQQGFVLRFYPSNVSEQLWMNPSWRTKELELFKRYLRGGDYVVDVGANVGDTVLTSSLVVGDAGRIWAIEPHPRIFGYLRGNLALNRVGNVVAINVAAGAQTGKLMFGDARRDDMNRIGEAGIVVDVNRLDDIVRFRGEVSLLKVDVEGYELFVLQGAQAVLSRTSCVLIEVSEAHFAGFGYCIRTVLEHLHQLGFDLVRRISMTSVERVDVDYFTSGVENLIGVRDLRGFLQRTGWRLS